MKNMTATPIQYRHASKPPRTDSQPASLEPAKVSEACCCRPLALFIRESIVNHERKRPQSRIISSRKAGLVALRTRIDPNLLTAIPRYIKRRTLVCTLHQAHRSNRNAVICIVLNRADECWQRK